MVALIRDMADYIGCDHKELVFLPNVTTAISTVIFSIDLTSDHEHAPSEVLMLDIGYGSVKKAAQVACDRAHATLVQAHVPLPLPEEYAPSSLVHSMAHRFDLTLVVDSLPLPLHRLHETPECRQLASRGCLVSS